jgi:hypothetical protein
MIGFGITNFLTRQYNSWMQDYLAHNMSQFTIFKLDKFQTRRLEK